LIHYHLPGLFEFYEFYKVFLPIFRNHRKYFYEWCEIASIYGAPEDCLWGGGREGIGENNPPEVLKLLEEYGISGRLCFSNSLLTKEHLLDEKCNELCRVFEKGSNGVIVHSDLLVEYIQKEYPGLYLISSTTKVITEFDDFEKELSRAEFRYVVPDFRLNISYERLAKLSNPLKNKVEFLCNECCSFECRDRKKCYEEVSRKNLGIESNGHYCKSVPKGEGYRFSEAMKNPGFIGIDDILKIYEPMGFSDFKIEGRSLGNAILLEFLLYYMTKPEYQLKVREEIYLDSMLDLF